MMPPDLYSADIGVNAIAVYGVLAIHVNGKTGECWPSYATIGKRLGLSRMTVYRAIKVLEENGFVLIENHHKDGKSNTYTLPHQTHTHTTGDTTPVPQVYPSRTTTDTPPVPPVVPKPYVIELNVIEPNEGVNLSDSSDDGQTPADAVKTSKPTKAPTYPEDMLRFWDSYPSVGRERSSRSKVLAVWKQQRPDADTLAAILHGVDVWKRKPEWCERFAPAADRWLRERKWEELPEATKSVDIDPLTLPYNSPLRAKLTGKAVLA
jgi:biotin operon repressor